MGEANNQITYVTGNSNTSMMQDYQVSEHHEDEPIKKAESKIKIPIFSSRSDDKTPLIGHQSESSRVEADLTYITAAATPDLHQK